MKKSFKGRVSRNATLHNRGPFGLVKRGDQLVSDPDHPEDVATVRECDSMYVAGNTLKQILTYVRQTSPIRGWKSQNGIRNALKSAEYVKAGLRSADIQVQIDARYTSNHGRYGTGKKGVHPLSGVFACGRCASLGVTALLHGNAPALDRRTYGKHGARLICLGSRHGRHSENFGVQEHALEEILLNMFDRMLFDIAVIQAWHQRRVSFFRASPEHFLKKRLEHIAIRRSDFARKRSKVGNFLLQDGNDIQEQAKLMLIEIANDEREANNDEVEILRQLSKYSGDPEADFEDVRYHIHRIRDTWHDANADERARIARSLVRAIGSHPIADRAGRASEIYVEWDAIFPDEIRTLKYGRRGEKMPVRVERIISRRETAHVASVSSA